MRSLTKQDGVALLLVLMLTAVLSTVVILQQYRTQNTLQLAEMTKDALEARNKGVSHRNALIFQLLTTDIWAYGPANTRQKDAWPATINFYGSAFTWQESEVSIMDSAGLLSLIPFEAEAWQAQLIRLGVENPATVTDPIEDWIDQDSFLRLNGAEAQDYATPGLPRNGIPQNINELQLVKNVTPELFTAIRPLITYFGSGQPAAGYAPAALLPALVGDFNATEMLVQRQGQPEQLDAILPQSGEGGGLYPSGRLLISIKTEVNKAVYQESFVLLRGLGAARFAYISEYQPNVIWKPE